MLESIEVFIAVAKHDHAPYVHEAMIENHRKIERPCDLHLNSDGESSFGPLKGSRVPRQSPFAQVILNMAWYRIC